MHIEPSSIAGIELVGPHAAEFTELLEALIGGKPPAALKPALPYSVIVRNNSARPLALLGTRFDMVSRGSKPYSVVHYADTLRHPENASLTPGAARFVCAERRYTDMVLRRESAVDRRGTMNLENLASAIRVVASLDCVAFCDGEFAGPDSHGAFDRFRSEREAECALIDEMLQAGADAEALLAMAIETQGEPARRALAKQFQASLAVGELPAHVRNHRLRIPLRRAISS